MFRRKQPVVSENSDVNTADVVDTKAALPEELYVAPCSDDEAKAEVLRMEQDVLQSTAGKAELKSLCVAANKMELGAIVVYPSCVKLCVGYLGKDPQVSLIAAISSPDGGDTTACKVYAVKQAVKDGVDEVEVFAPSSFIKDGNWAYFKRECKKLKRAAGQRGFRLVMDCSAIPEKELYKACNIAADIGVGCLRLKNADASVIKNVKKAIKSKCRIKAENAASLSYFRSLCAVGADVVGCNSALQIAELVLKKFH